jgi:NitT/TauT family transport system permease protein
MIVDEFQAGKVLGNLFVTIQRALIGLGGVLVIGVSVGIAMARWWRVRALLDDLVYVGVALPAFILALLIVMWWGFNPMGPVVLVIAAATPLMILSTREGAMAVDADLVKMSSSYGVKTSRRLGWLVVPAMMEYIVSGIRSSALAAWGALLLIEWFGSGSGAGFRAHEWYSHGSMTGLMAWGVIWIVVVMLIDGLILGRLLKHFTKWRGSDSGAWSGGAGPVH